jgi:phosphoribosylformimino-5-aminoimidazole carboxamide ribotide isomerase
MIFFPAIDLKDGCCVRLVRGEMDSATVFNESPAAQAAAFREAGCSWLHVVDLDAAFAGRPVNTAAVDAILRAFPGKVQLGGGIRDMATARQWLDRGVHRVILGTAAVNDPAFVRDACLAFPGRVALGIDARDGRVAVDGWADTTEMSAFEVAFAFEDVGPAAIIYTDGVSGMDDLHAIRAEGAGVLEGVICGRAIYEGRVDAKAAVSLLAADDER